ncbi:hypothetical protein [Streptomyces sp. NPDC001903]|uniref:hypothetical protein n=1 Tax=Streptomyces sp. NPDC001903 TaxID=3364622 RepID=UPI00367AAA9E
MTSNEAESTPVAVDEGVQEIPPQITVTEVPAATEARDRLLAAIGAEAQLVVEKSTGQASATLVELGRAYAVTTSSTYSEGVRAAKAVMWTGEEVGLWGAQDYARTLANTATPTDLSTPEETEQPPTAVGVSEGIQQTPARIILPPLAPAAADARDKLMAAIGAEAQRITERADGQASAALAELAHAYALVTAGPRLLTEDKLTADSVATRRIAVQNAIHAAQLLRDSANVTAD